MASKKPIVLYEGDLKVLQTGDTTPGMDYASEASSIAERASSLARLASSEGVNGSVFITDLEPQSSGNVGSKVTSSDGDVLDSCVTDTNLLTVSVLALPGDTNFKPYVEIDSVQVPLTAQSDEPLFRGTLNIDLAGATSITVIHEDGASHTCQITADTPPVVQTAVFTGGYPGTQTELKVNDYFDLNVVSDIAIVTIEVDNFGAFQADTFGVASGLNHTITGTIANRGTSVQNLGARVRVQKSTGSWSAWFLTTSAGSTDGTHTVKLNNLFPSVNIGTITYPVTQSALKDSETATVANTVSNQSTISYTSGNGDLLISNSTAYEPSKTVTRNGGNYNISANNFTITATRTPNNAVTAVSTVVFIANVLPVINLSLPYSRLRSGGNDGTSAQNYTVTLNSNQRLISAPTLNAGGGTLTNSFTGGPSTWTRNIQIDDDDTKGSFSFSSLSAMNLSNMEQTVINSGASYTLGGFVSRSIALAAFIAEANMNVAVDTYSKTTLSWSFKPSLTIRAALNSTPPIVDNWCVVATDTNPTTIRILDTSAVAASSQESTITIEEAV